ncbi:MAG: sodium:proton exchanger [Tenericutes bacterium HGW-Tenericutes-8]|nr:MAG: sodium:proton exchanger [Tenericutes bacterium HGW-Tenericutes-8]
MPFLLLVFGFVLLVKGADLFVDGASSIAKFFKVSSLVIGLTVVAFGTSLPEAAVSISASIAGVDDVSLGNIVGSNIFNILFILGLSAVIVPQIVHGDLLSRDFLFSILSALILIPFYYFIGEDHSISRMEGAILLIIFLGFLYSVFKHSKQTELLEIETINPKYPIKKALLITLLGLVGIVFGGVIVTNAAREIAIKLGMSEWLVGLTIVSIGTSLPELVTSVVAAIKKESEIAIGNVVGSNIFNVLFILGFSATISPIRVNASALFDVLFLLIISIITYLFALSSRKISRIEGLFMFLSYMAYMAYIIIRDLNG